MSKKKDDADDKKAALLADNWYQNRILTARVPEFTEKRFRMANYLRLDGTEDAIRAVVDFVDDKKRPHHFLTLASEPGRGKTHLAFAVAWYFLKMYKPQGGTEGLQNCRTVLYYQVEDLLDNLRSCYSDDAKSGAYERRMEQLKNIDFLILDDLGAENSTDWAQAKLNQLIDYRYFNDKLTMFTLNIKKEELHPRVSSRLGEGVIATITSGDFREEIARRRREDA